MNVKKFPFCPHGVPLEDLLFILDNQVILWKTTGEIQITEWVDTCLEKEKPSPRRHSRRASRQA